MKADFAPKLFSIPVRVKASDAEDGSPRYYLDQRIGIAVTGSFFSAQATVGILPEICGRLLGIPGETDISLRGFVSAIASVYARVARQVGEILYDKALGQILVLGHCPKAAEDQVWRIELAVEPTGITPKVYPVAFGPTAVFFGSGAPAARQLAKDQPKMEPFRIVKKLCEDEQLLDVGGNIQFGAVPARDFEIFAIQEHRMDDSSGAVNTGIFLAGVELLRRDDEWIEHGLYPAPSILRPFLPDIRFLEQRGYEIVPFD